MFANQIASRPAPQVGTAALHTEAPDRSPGAAVPLRQAPRFRWRFSDQVREAAAAGTAVVLQQALHTRMW